MYPVVLRNHHIQEALNCIEALYQFAYQTFANLLRHLSGSLACGFHKREDDQRQVALKLRPCFLQLNLFVIRLDAIQVFHDDLDLGGQLLFQCHYS